VENYILSLNWEVKFSLREKKGKILRITWPCWPEFYQKNTKLSGKKLELKPKFAFTLDSLATDSSLFSTSYTLLRMKGCICAPQLYFWPVMDSLVNSSLFCWEKRSTFNNSLKCSQWCTYRYLPCFYFLLYSKNISVLPVFFELAAKSFQKQTDVIFTKQD